MKSPNCHIFLHSDHNVVIRGVDICLSIDHILEDLIQQGFHPKEAVRLTKKDGKTPIPLLKLRLPESERRIYQMQQLCNVDVTVETQISKKIPINPCRISYLLTNPNPTLGLPYANSTTTSSAKEAPQVPIRSQIGDLLRHYIKNLSQSFEVMREKRDISSDILEASHKDSASNIDWHTKFEIKTPIFDSDMAMDVKVLLGELWKDDLRNSMFSLIEIAQNVLTNMDSATLEVSRKDQLPSEDDLIVVIRGAHVSLSVEDIREDLLKQGFHPKELVRLSRRDGQTPISVVKLRISNTENRIFQLRQLCHFDVNVEHFKHNGIKVDAARETAVASSNRGAEIVTPRAPSSFSVIDANLMTTKEFKAARELCLQQLRNLILFKIEVARNFVNYMDSAVLELFSDESSPSPIDDTSQEDSNDLSCSDTDLRVKVPNIPIPFVHEERIESSRSPSLNSYSTDSHFSSAVSEENSYSSEPQITTNWNAESPVPSEDSEATGPSFSTMFKLTRNVIPIVVSREDDRKVDLYDINCGAMFSSGLPHGLEIRPVTMFDRYEIVDYLRAKNIKYHILFLTSDLHVVIRGVPFCLTIDMIREELYKEGFDPKEIVRMTKHHGQTPIPIVKLRLSKEEDSIFQLKRLYGIDVRVETQRSKPSGTNQCHNCQYFGHVASSCSAQPRCMKCGKNHNTRNCKIKRSSLPNCANCDGLHRSNYIGCTKNPLNQPTPVSIGNR